MKTKNKILALLEIAIVLCSVFLVAIPAIAAEQNQETQEVSAAEVTTASEDDYVLGIYGNANEDDTIDMRDLTYVKLIFFGKKPETELSDAKYDGKINPLDFIQIKLIIVGKEKELTFVDSDGKAVSVEKPVERVIPKWGHHQADAIRVLGAEYKVVGVATELKDGDKALLPVMSELPSIGSYMGLDFEAILALEPDIFITVKEAHDMQVEEQEEKIGPYVTIVRLDLNAPKTILEEMKKLGYILDKRNEAEEFVEFYKEYIEDEIKTRTEGLSEDDKPRVFIEYAEYGGYMTVREGVYSDQMVNIAGGINIATDITGDIYPDYPIVDPEWIIAQNPDIILKFASEYTPVGYWTDDITGVKALREEVMNRPGWDCISAVKNGDVYLVSFDIECGVQHFIAIPYYGKWFHRDLFEDLNPEAIHQEYLDRFQRIDYDLDEHGVFVYPPIEIDGDLAGIPDKWL